MREEAWHEALEEVLIDRAIERGISDSWGGLASRAVLRSASRSWRPRAGAESGDSATVGGHPLGGLCGERDGTRVRGQERSR
jgi:hypothetical protein